MNKLLIICGPTATGKTSLGLKLAQRFDGEIISADSRQVYKGLDIGTGKDLPKSIKAINSNLKFLKSPIKYYLISGVRLWGYDLTTPDEDFSVGHYVNITQKVIQNILARNKLPIIVGGTGFYIHSLFKPPQSLHIKPDKKLRNILNDKSLLELQKDLTQLDQEKINHMNQSDKNNPRRLIRAIEIAKVRVDSFKPPNSPTRRDTLWIGLTTKLSTLDKKIQKRVKQRLRIGIVSEVKKLISLYPSWHTQAFSSTGYAPIKKFIEGKITKKEALKLWIKSETQYARRQLTWFKKQSSIVWFDTNKKNTRSDVVRKVKTWYA